tara:strand:+ start:2150 stop:2710 length:561 start_codon:yes stop_codon:yes gene_type:complete
MIYKEDKGTDFGKWNDTTSEFLYKTSTKEILNILDIKGVVADYGGANGNLKTFLPNSISIDIDSSKKPDIIDNILTHNKKYDWVIIRYVLHYLTDKEIIQLFNNIQSDNILIIQFTNENLKIKYSNSKNEIKYFRTRTQLESLLPKKTNNIYRKVFNCASEFYKNRLGLEKGIEHIETLNAYFIKN